MRTISPLLAGLLAVACGPDSSRTPVSEPAPAPAPKSAAPTPDAAAAPAISPDQQLDWVVATINQGGQVTEEIVTERFAPTFLEQIPAAKMVALFEQIGKQLAPLEKTAVESEGGRLVGRYSSAAGPVQVVLEVEASSGKMTTLLVQPDPGAVSVPESWPEIEEQLAASGATSQLLVARIERGKCKPVRAVSPETSLAMGSTFKLYVLHALARRIAAGKLDWDTALAIRDEWKSLPSGTMQNLEAGTERTVRQFAEKMISISDNTATDHLIHTVGRRQVEASVRKSGHSAPRKNIPFLTTRDMFVLKLATPEAELETYLKKKPEARRRALDGALGQKKVTLADAADWTEPRRLEALEWFGSANDLCRALASLRQLAGRKKELSPVFEILAKNPGLTIDEADWPYVGFKGGSEPGVLSAAFLLRHQSGDWYAVIGQVNDPAKPVEEAKALGAVQGVFKVLAKDLGASSAKTEKR